MGISPSEFCFVVAVRLGFHGRIDARSAPSDRASPRDPYWDLVIDQVGSVAVLSDIFTPLTPSSANSRVTRSGRIGSPQGEIGKLCENFV
jgi:hypothetical protein